MDNQKPVTAEEIAKMKKNGKTMLAIAAAVFVLIVILTVATAGGAPTWMILIVGMSLALGLIEMRKAKKAEAELQTGATPTPPTPPTPPSEPTV